MRAQLPRFRPRPRLLELALLPFPLLVLAIGLLQIDLAEGHWLMTRDRLLVVGFGSALLLIHLWLSAREPAADQVLMPLASVLCALSLVMMARLVPDLVVRQAVWFGAGLLAFILTLALIPSIG